MDALTPLPPKHEEQFTAFIDFLGFSEASSRTDNTTQPKILDLLLSLSALRNEFDLQSKEEKTGKSFHIVPAISTFSDHIVISFPLERLRTEFDMKEHVVASIVMSQFNQLLARIAAAALHIGFLVRGGAAIGNLYHSRGVVFGEAMIEAFKIESRTSVYPRVVLSSTITSRPEWMEHQTEMVKGDDGLYQMNYFKMLIFSAATPGDAFKAMVSMWFTDVCAVISRNLDTLEKDGRLNELAKWSWFAREFRRGFERLNPVILDDLGISLDATLFGKSTR